MEATANSANILNSLFFITPPNSLNDLNQNGAHLLLLIRSTSFSKGVRDSSLDGIKVVDSHPHDSRMTNSVRIRVKASACSPLISLVNWRTASRPTSSIG